MRIRPLDYILDKHDNFWIVKQVVDGLPYGQLVYQVVQDGRYNMDTKKDYHKVINAQLERYLLIKDIKQVYYPDDFYMNHKQSLSEKWLSLVTILNEIGIKDEYIGVFGSYLIGFAIEKDVDFVVYGIDSYKKIKSNIKYIQKKLGVTAITDEHIAYQVNKYHHMYNDNNNLSDILKHNWVGLQFGEHVLSTIRFIKRNKHYQDIKGVEKTITGLVHKDDGTNFLPRVGIIKNKDKSIKVITYFWMFNAFLKKGEKVKIKGIYNKFKNELYLVNDKHWIKYLN